MEIICDVALPVLSAFQSAIDLAFSFFGDFIPISAPDIYGTVGGLLGCIG